MTRNQIKELGIFADVPFAPNRHQDLFGVGTAIAGASQAIASVGAAVIQAGAANNAARLAKESADASLNFNRDVFNTGQENAKPWLEAGKTALGQLSAGTAPGGQFTTPYGKQFSYDKFTAPGDFKAPAGVDEQNDPGYAFRLSEGQKALERSAAAKGTATGGGALKAAARYGQDYASNEYGNVYSRALGTYQNNFQKNLGEYNTNFNGALTGFNTNYNVWNQDQGNQFNRLSSLAGTGQTAVGQLQAGGQAAASNVAGIQGNLGNNLSSLATQQGNAYGAGAVGVGNAITGGINNYQNNQMLQQILAQRGSGYAPPQAQPYRYEGPS